MMFYNDLVKEHFFSPRNITPDNIDLKNRLVFEKGDKLLGDWVRVTYQCNANEEILYFTYKVLGHPFLVAGLSLWSEKLIGKTLGEASQLTHQALITAFVIPKNKQYIAFFLEDLLSEIVSTWRENNGKR